MIRNLNRIRLPALLLLVLWAPLRPWLADGPFGTITRIAEDTNFDGRADRFSYFQGGILVRRESDLNFDGRVDEVEQFDVDGELTRTIRDIDFDGVADVLVLYLDGVPVHKQRAGDNQVTASRSAGYGGGSMVDPFLNETAVYQVNRVSSPLPALTAPPETYTLPPGSPSLSFRATFLVPTVLTRDLPVNPHHTSVRGPPASDSVLL
jgi:hypothetical protein